MSKYKLIALDMDGTLLNSSLKLSEGNIQAVHRAAAAGKHVVFSTGRCLVELEESLRLLPEVRYLVCENGSCVYDVQTGETIHVDPVPEEEIRFILDLLKDENKVLHIFHDNKSYFHRKDSSWLKEFNVENYAELFNETAIWDEHLMDRYLEKPFRVEKFNLYFDNPETRDRIHAILEKRNLKLSDSVGYMIEVIASQADKARGLQRLCEHLGIAMEDTIAVGDSPNDLTVLKAAGFSAAMGNAWPEAKALADFITDDCDHDGVARVIDEILLAE